MSQNEWLMFGFVVFLTVAYFISQRATYENGVWDGAYNTWLPQVRKILDEDHPYGSVKACQRERALLAPDRGDGTRAAGDGWRDISTAPKDGSDVLLGWYEKPIADPGTWTWIAVGGWFENGPADRCWYDIQNEPCEPTHWMPMAPPPAAGDRNGGGR